MRIVVWDTETSGLNYDTGARILTCYAGIYEDGKLIEDRSWILDWGIDIPKEASEVNGLTREYLAEHGRKDPEDAIFEMEEFIFQERYIAAYNIPFDMTMLLKSIQGASGNSMKSIVSDTVFSDRVVGKPVFIDALVMDKAMDKYRKGSRKLMDTARHYGFEIDESRLHEAQYDVEKTAEVTFEVLKRWRAKNPGKGPQHLMGYQITARREQQRSLKAYFDRTGKEYDDVDVGFPAHTSLLEVL